MKAILLIRSYALYCLPCILCLLCLQSGEYGGFKVHYVYYVHRFYLGCTTVAPFEQMGKAADIFLSLEVY